MKTRTKLTGAMLSAVLLCSGHSALVAHADSGAGTAIGNGNVTCTGVVTGGKIIDGMNETVATVSGEEYASGAATCVSLTGETYTLYATITIEDGNGWICHEDATPFNAVDGVAVVDIAYMPCVDWVNPYIQQTYTHVAHLSFWTSAGDGPYDDYSSTWTVTY